MINNKDKERFERFFDKTKDGCWEWKGYRCKDGYGAFSYNGKIVKAHRFSYELYIGKIPEGLLVCHHCDNPACVRPDHLFASDQKGNMKDMDSKNRRVNRKFSEEEAKAFGEASRERWKDPEYKMNKCLEFSKRSSGHKMPKHVMDELVRLSKERWKDPEYRKKMSAISKSNFENPEIRKRILDAHKGRKASEETKRKMSLSMRGKKRSEETRKRMSEANKRRFIDPTYKERMLKQLKEGKQKRLEEKLKRGLK